MKEEIYTEYEEYEIEHDGATEVRSRSWVVIPDQMWEESTSTDYINGIPMLFPNQVYKKVRS